MRYSFFRTSYSTSERRRLIILLREPESGMRVNSGEDNCSHPVKTASARQSYGSRSPGPHVLMGSRTSHSRRSHAARETGEQADAEESASVRGTAGSSLRYPLVQQERNLGLQSVDPMIEFRQFRGAGVVEGSRSGHDALQGQARKIGDVAGAVDAILLLQDFVLHLGEAEADHLASGAGVRHEGKLWGG